jgi:hypothetical protein
MSDRILVMREGRQMAILDHREATQERVLAAAMGQADELLVAADETDEARAAAAEAVAVIDQLVAGEAIADGERS